MNPVGETAKLQRNLTALVEFSRIVNSSHDIDFTLNNLLFSLMGKFLTGKGVVALETNGFFVVAAHKGFVANELSNFPALPFEENLEDSERLNSLLEIASLGIVAPIRSARRLLGFLALGNKINGEEYSNEEVEFLKTILNIAATGIENSLFINELKSVNRDLDTRIAKLNSLFELTKEFSVLTEESRIGKTLLFSLLGNFMVGTYAIVYGKDHKMKVLESTLPKTQLIDILKTCPCDSLTATIEREGIGTVFPELLNFGFELLVPMKMQSETKGLILLGKRLNAPGYSPADKDFINSLASLAITSLENKRLFIEALEKQKMEEELEVAKGIQTNLLPKVIPQFPFYEIAASSISSKQVGGDYYDIIPGPDNGFYTAIADVSGKGVPASLLMANLQAFLKSICKQSLDLSEATALINDLVSENTTDGKFITFFWALFSNEKRALRYVNAGHNPVLLVRNHELKFLDQGGLILGVMKTFMPYKSDEIQLEPDDLIVFFTDGVTEAKNLADDEYSDQRLEELVKINAHKTADEILDIIKKDVSSYAHGATQSDDITIIVIKVR